jgi:threonine/homoserine/homoserine lactone efflux protein
VIANWHDKLPIEPAVLLPFLLAVVLIEVTPGPNMGYLAALSASQGRVAGFRAVLGVTVGLAFYMILAVAGVAELIAAAPLVYGLLRWAGVLFLLYLAWEAWRGVDEASPGHPADVDHAPFWRGLVANVLNPKAAVFYVTLLPGFIADDHAPFWIQALMLGSVHLLVSFVIHSAIVIGAARMGAPLASEGRATAVRRLMAVAIALIAVWLAWETRSA